MKDVLLQIVALLVVVGLGLLEPLLNKLLGRAVGGRKEEATKVQKGIEETAIAPTVKAERQEEPIIVRPKMAAVKEPQAEKGTKAERKPIDKRKLIIYSEIMKPKFDEF